MGDLEGEQGDNVSQNSRSSSRPSSRSSSPTNSSLDDTSKLQAAIDLEWKLRAGAENIVKMFSGRDEKKLNPSEKKQLEEAQNSLTESRQKNQNPHATASKAEKRRGGRGGVRRRFPSGGR
eukprot:comp23759_c0_seq1/m.41130 comp23759_c0_seq1/g.41130  ORF comp23759_c0_seq1/g.41130 comp23759_c0_seq1/m.41130 type:complete len:121 (-) comp23759_c0_seq1:2433-2795(-)